MCVSAVSRGWFARSGKRSEVMRLFFQQFLSNGTTIAVPAMGISLGFWGFRRRLESDHKLDRIARSVRWGIVLTCWILGSIPGRGIGPFSALAVVVGLAFLWWPTFAYHLARLFRLSDGGCRQETAFL